MKKIHYFKPTLQVLLIVFITTVTTSCSAQKSATNNRPPKDGKRPSITQLFKKFDANKDNLLSKKETNGRLLQNFDRIDENKDGFLSKAELEAKRIRDIKQRPNRKRNRK